MMKFSPPADMQDGVHRLNVRVYFEDTDAGGIVYHANYLRFAERGRSEALRAMGVAHAAMMSEQGRMFVVRRANLDYQRPARLDDELTIETRTKELGAARLVLAQAIKRGAETLVEIELHLACVDVVSARPVRLPAETRLALAWMMRSD
jgi:acyl-CoA thioester hydrolase